MLVETYEIEECTTGDQTPIEVESEAEHLIGELGLKGQEQLLVVDDEGDAHRIPYQRMSQEEMKVYKTLYPETDDHTEYSSGPFPLRVLQVIAHGRTLFDSMAVWYPQTSDPDPVLVGWLADDSGGDTPFMLARWGDAIEPFEVLYERAVETVSTTWKANAEDVASRCMAFMDSPGALVKKYLRGKHVYEPWT